MVQPIVEMLLHSLETLQFAIKMHFPARSAHVTKPGRHKCQGDITLCVGFGEKRSPCWGLPQPRTGAGAGG
jgi:hypothetical protein